MSSTRYFTPDNLVKASISSQPTARPPWSFSSGKSSLMTLPNGHKNLYNQTQVGPWLDKNKYHLIGSRDLNNTEFLVIKSIYNIVG